MSTRKNVILPAGIKSIGITGKGRSFIEEYVNTLPEVTEEDILEGKCDGRTIMSFEL